VPTVNLSTQPYPENLPKSEAAASKTLTPLLGNGKFKKFINISSPKVFIATGIALVAATAGFAVTTLLNKIQSPSLTEPVVEKPDANKQKPAANFTPLPLSKETNTAQKENSTASQVQSAPAAKVRRRRSRRVSTEQAPSTNVTKESPQTDSKQSQPRQSQQDSQPGSEPSTTSSRPLVERLRAIRESRNTSSPSSGNNPPSSRGASEPSPPTSQPNNSRVVPAQPSTVESKQSDPSAVVVPTIEQVKQKPSAETQIQLQPEKEDKNLEKLQTDNN